MEFILSIERVILELGIVNQCITIGNQKEGINVKLVIPSDETQCDNLKYLFNEITKKREELNELYRTNNVIDSLTVRKSQELDLLIYEYMTQQNQNGA